MGITYEQIAEVNKKLNATDVKGKMYVEVNQRIKAFRMLYPNGAIIPEIVSLDGGVCVMQVTILDDEGKILAKGTAYENEGSSFINKTSYIENCETSAVGRALGMCGIGIDTSVASYEEVANAITQQEADKIAKQKISDVKVNALLSRCGEDGVDVEKLKSLYKVKSLADLTEKQFANIHEHWNKIKGE